MIYRLKIFYCVIGLSFFVNTCACEKRYSSNGQGESSLLAKVRVDTDAGIRLRHVFCAQKIAKINQYKRTQGNKSYEIYEAILMAKSENAEWHVVALSYSEGNKLLKWVNISSSTKSIMLDDDFYFNYLCEMYNKKK